MVYATIGVVLGIVAGTILADGSWRSMSPFASHQPVRANSSVPGPAARPVINVAKTPALNPQPIAQPSPQLPPALKPSAASQAPAVNLQAVVTPKSPQLLAAPAPAAARVPVSVKRPPASALAKAPITTRTPAAVKVSGAAKFSVGHRHRSLRKFVAGKKFLSGRRRGHGRRRLHARLRAASIAKAAIAARISPKPGPQKLVDADVPFSFMVEGNVTVANFDALAGTIETYEGETFALDRSPTENSTVSWLDYPPDIHYRCDQSWKCTLIHDGVVIVNARRTR